MERVALTTSLGKLLDWCSIQQATDLHAQADRRFAYRVDGKLLRIPPAQFPAPTNEEIMSLLRQAFSSSIFERIEKQHELDLSFLCEKVRYRANFNKQQGTQAFSFRVVPQKIPKLDDLELPASVAKARPLAPCCKSSMKRWPFASLPLKTPSNTSLKKTNASSGSVRLAWTPNPRSEE